MRQVLTQAPGLKLIDAPGISLYPQPRTISGTNEVAVGRIRQDARTPHRIALWTTADNLRKGTALNALQIAEEGIKRGVF
jgi:aspartate-semialdehyde dehydrogenase